MTTHIIVVDSQPGTLKLIGLMLQRGGFAAVKTENPRLALDMLGTFSPDLFIIDTDLATPELNGIEFCRVIRKLPHRIDIPIIMLAQPGDIQSAEEAMRAGATDYLFKPILHYDLLAKVRQALGLESSDSRLSAIGISSTRLDARA